MKNLCLAKARSGQPCQKYPVRGKKIDKTVELIKNNVFFKITLGNCLISKVNNTIIVSKEY